jgi:hypothetical protein
MAQEYEDVAAGQTAQVLGDAVNGRGQHISHIIVIPATTSPGAVALLDDSTSLTVFAGGATSVSNLVPFTIFLGCDSKNGPWKITTGANVAVRAVGDFN